MRFGYFQVRHFQALESFLARFPVLILLCGGLCYSTGFAADPGDDSPNSGPTLNPAGAIVSGYARLPALITLTNAWFDGTNGVLLAGGAAGDQSGVSVSLAGDVNGDGYADVLVGAYYASPGGHTYAGETYLVYGRSNGLPASITLTNTWFNGTNGVRLAGGAAGDQSGVSVSAAGDVNGDGYADVLVGAYYASPGGRSYAGETYLVYGRSNGLPASITLTNTWFDGTNGVRLAGGAAGDRSGISVSSAGDVNGDGCADVLVGASYASPGGLNSAGETYLVYGRSNGLPASIALTNTWFDGVNGVRLAGGAMEDWSGVSAGSAGDVNGDGYADVLVGAYYASPGGRTYAGETYLVYGRSNGLPALITLTNAWFDGTNGVRLAGGAAGDRSGISVSSAGDVNGDGYADVLVGAYCASPDGRSYAGETYLVYGRSSGLPALITLTNTWFDGTNGVRLAGGAAGDRSGISVSSAGDVNGDGCADVLVGASYASPGGLNSAGETYLVYGRSNGLPASITLTNAWFDGVNGVRLAGGAADDWSGVSVSSAGDVNGDGHADLLVGASYASPGGRYAAGATYLIFGGSVIAPVAPSAGSYTGGYQVVITGTSLGNGADITNVTLCGVSASIQSQSATQIVVVAGAASPGLGDVRVYSVSFGETVKSNAFTYVGMPRMTLIGTNREVVVSGEPSSLAKGTAFGWLPAGSIATHMLSITNAGNATLTIGGWVTNGSGAGAFTVSDLPSSLSVSSAVPFRVTFNAAGVGEYNAALVITNDSATTPYVVNLAGSVYRLSPGNGLYQGGNSVTISNVTLGSGTDITNVLVGGVSATIEAQGANWVRITMPSHIPGTVDIMVQSMSVGGTMLPGAYTYYEFSYRKPITLSSGASLTNYQVRITVDTATLVAQSKLQADCDDLRFATSNGYSPIDYWIESGTNTTNTVIWAEVPSVANGSTTIYMYYGNASATAGSSGDNTFIFFDDFDDGSLNTNKWVSGQYGGGNTSITETGGYVRLYANTANLKLYATIGTVNTYTYPMTVHWKARAPANEVHGFVATAPTQTSTYDSNQVHAWVTEHTDTGFTPVFSVVSNRTTIARLSADTWSSFMLKVNSGASTLTMDSTTYANSDTFSYTNDYIKVGVTKWYPAFIAQYDYDYIFVRKYAASEPTMYRLSADNGLYPGGNSVTITNGTLGSGADITNVLVGGVAATIEAQGANWVRITMPPHVAGTVDIVAQSASVGDTTLSGAYTYEYTYRKPITLSSGASLTNYQVRMTVDTATLVAQAKLQADCDDLRFTTSDGYSLIDYWIESGANTTNTDYLGGGAQRGQWQYHDLHVLRQFIGGRGEQRR